MKREITSIRLKKEIKELLSEQAEQAGRTISELVREAIQLWIEERKEKQSRQNKEK